MTSWRCDFLLIWCLIGGGHFDLDSSFRAISFTTNELHKIFWKHPLIHIMPDYECTDIVLGSESRKAGINLKKSRHALFEDPNLNVLRARPDFS